jgi:hypothetical protein
LNAATLTPSPSRPHTTENDKRSQADKRIDFLLEKHFRNDPEQRPLLLKLAEHDPTPKKKYLAWLVKHWTGAWKPNDKELKKVSEHLETHHKGSKYFSPLSWTGLRLEDAGYHADIFRYTPQTLGTLSGRIAEMIRIDEEDKQIRKGNLVITGGAEVAYKDERWTVLRIRTKDALRRLGQGTSWCVRHGNLSGYQFPFDFLLNNEGERFLANRQEVRDRWDRLPTPQCLAEIKRVRVQASDKYDQIDLQVEEAIERKLRLESTLEKQVMRYPDLAIRYAEKVIGGVWPEYERYVRVATLSAENATDYAIKCRRERWPRFENKIKNSRPALARYRKAFPGSIPPTNEEIFQEKLDRWRQRKAKARQPVMRWSVQWQAESRVRNVKFEDRLLLKCSEASIDRYARLLVSLATSELEPDYREKFRSYFLEAKDERTQVVNDELGPIICAWVHQRMPEIEPLIMNHPENAFAYATGTARRFLAGEAAIQTDHELWEAYVDTWLRVEKPHVEPETTFPRRLMAPNFKIAWR